MSDQHKAVLQGDLNKALNEISRAVERHLQEFQQGLVQVQVRMNLVWNATNAIIRALMNKGLITEDDIKAAGAQLYEEMKQNIEMAKAAVEQKRMPTSEEKVEAPLDKMHRLIYPESDTKHEKEN